MTVLMEGQAPRTGTRRLSTQTVLAATLLGAICASRLSTLNYNTAFVDEAIYLTVGQRVVQGDFRDNALQWMTGSYIYPVTSALAAQVGQSGLTGARTWAVFVSAWAAVGVYVLARRLFDATSALLALLLFGFTGVSVFTGTLATYDCLGVGALGLSAALLAEGLFAVRWRSQCVLLFGSGLLFSLSVLSKYIALAWGVALAVLWLVLLGKRQWRRLAVFTGAFAVPVVVIIGIYVAVTWHDMQLFIAQFGALTGQPAERLAIVGKISYAVRLPFVLGLLGTGYSLWQGKREQWGVLAVLWIAAAIMPIHHLASANARSIDKSMTYALVFLAPLAGHGLCTILELVPHRISRQVTTIAFVGVFVLVSLQIWSDQAWVMQRTWPNAEKTIQYLRELPTTPETQVLAEGGNIYDYYLDWGGRRAKLTTTWATYFSYDGLQGEHAMNAAIRDHYFDYLIFDGYYTPDLSSRLADTAVQAGYTRVFTDQAIALGEEARPFTFEVFARQ